MPCSSSSRICARAKPATAARSLLHAPALRQPEAVAGRQPAARRAPAPRTRAAVAAPAAVPSERPASSRRRPQADLAELWASLLEAVGRASPFTRTYLLEAHPVSFQQERIHDRFRPRIRGPHRPGGQRPQPRLAPNQAARTRPPERPVQVHQGRGPAGRASTAGRPPRPARSAPATRRPSAPPAAKPAAAPPPPAKEKLASVPFSKDDFKNDPLIRRPSRFSKARSSKSAPDCPLQLSPSQLINLPTT